MRRLHITGCPRSGTTLLMEQMSTCFENDGHCEHERSVFDNVALPSGLYISKQPSDIKHLGHIFHRDDELYIIYLLRDPRSVITSKHGAASQQYFCNYRVWQDCERAAANYAGHPRFLRLRYEDLVADPDRVQACITSLFWCSATRSAISINLRGHRMPQNRPWAECARWIRQACRNGNSICPGLPTSSSCIPRWVTT